VDDAIVVVENVTRYLEQGVSPLEAALRGAQEIALLCCPSASSLVRRLYSHPIDGWYRRATIPRIAVTLSIAILVSWLFP
jgi:multidrug efflux pump